MKIKFKDLQVGDLIRFDYMNGCCYVTDIDWEKQTFHFSSFRFLFPQKIKYSSILTRGDEYELVGIVRPKNKNIFKKIIDFPCKSCSGQELFHPFEAIYFTDIDKRIIELFKNIKN